MAAKKAKGFPNYPPVANSPKVRPIGEKFPKLPVSKKKKVTPPPVNKGRSR